ncbi:hypothetical protein ABD76_21120 [Paenibacillus dendritiformis]|uniref:hypothetical protein n=1 Tax=Paenibacillus dendritiformis TaxID=130049 RepID=UPI0018CEFBBC|nr:hypothetical protein [Paenibacillus dendritiformis]MBG9794843.1 hypothetical protein [Paenibacillus dendritiformis]
MRRDAGLRGTGRRRRQCWDGSASDAVRTGYATRIRSDYADAFRTQLVTCAASECAKSGRPMRPVKREAAE